MKSNKYIKPVVVNVETDGKTITYRLTRKKPTLALYVENNAAFEAETEHDETIRKIGLFLDAALCELAQLPPELHSAVLLEHGLATTPHRVGINGKPPEPYKVKRRTHIIERQNR